MAQITLIQIIDHDDFFLLDADAKLQFTREKSGIHTYHMCHYFAIGEPLSKSSPLENLNKAHVMQIFYRV